MSTDIVNENSFAHIIDRWLKQSSEESGFQLTLMLHGRSRVMRPRQAQNVS